LSRRFLMVVMSLVFLIGSTAMMLPSVGWFEFFTFAPPAIPRCILYTVKLGIGQAIFRDAFCPIQLSG